MLDTAELAEPAVTGSRSYAAAVNWGHVLLLRRKLYSFCVRVLNLRYCHLSLTLDRAALCIHMIRT
jgi:hypothetical protein